MFDSGEDFGVGGEAFEAFDLFAGAIEDEGDGELVEVELFVERFAAEADGVVHRVFLQEGLHAGDAFFIHRNADYGDAVVVEFVETGDLLNAGDAPGGPEIYDDNFAGERGGVGGGAV